jgi:hypothetical protein
VGRQNSIRAEFHWMRQKVPRLGEAAHIVSHGPTKILRRGSAARRLTAARIA